MNVNITHWRSFRAPASCCNGMRLGFLDLLASFAATLAAQSTTGSAGGCAATCVFGYSVCQADAGAYCADFAADFNNCGSCGHACTLGGYCSDGGCIASSLTARIACVLG